MRSLRNRLTVVLLLACLAPAGTMAQERMQVRLKELGRLDGWRENALVGYGLVTGLAGTGDLFRNRATSQSLSNLLSQFGLSLTSEQVQSRNVAAVMVTASLPPFARAGGRVDVTVSSLGDARSLVGGVLLLTPLKGPDARIHALAQGPVSVGGYKYDLLRQRRAEEPSHGGRDSRRRSDRGRRHHGSRVRRGYRDIRAQRTRLHECEPHRGGDQPRVRPGARKPAGRRERRGVGARGGPGVRGAS